MGEAIDLAGVDSRGKAEAMFRAGKLQKLFLMPQEFGGADSVENVLYAPTGAVNRKAAIDLEAIRELAEAGKISKYSASATYEGKSVVPSSITITASEPETYRWVINIWGEAAAGEERQWDAVYAAREAAYAAHFGKISGDVQKLMNLTGVWPGGCLVQIQSARHGLWVTSSFGLTNADMPAGVTIDSSSAGTSEAGDAQYTSTLRSRAPRPVPAGWAGYGYEVLLLTRRQEFWPLMFLNWSVQMEILRDMDLRGRMQRYGAMTVEAVDLGEGRSGDFLIAPLQRLAPQKIALPNGEMELLAATLVTREEMEYGVKRGGPALLARIMARGQGQVSG